MRFSTALISFLLCLALLATAQPVLAAGKVGTVDMPSVLRQYEEVKKAVSYIKGKKDEYQQVIDKLQSEVRQINEDLQIHEEDWSADKKKSVEREKRKKIFELQNKYQSLRGKLDQIESEEFDIIKDRIRKELQTIAKKRGLDVVIEKQWVYYGATVDLTQDLIKALSK